MWAFILMVLHSAAFQAGIYGAGAAAAVDYHAFLTWKSVSDLKAYNWGTAFFRWGQGFLTALIMVGVKSAGVAALAPAALAIGTIWAVPAPGRRHGHWAQPVLHEGWAYVADMLFGLSKLSGYRILNHAKHRAWEKACGIAALLLLVVLCGLSSTACAGNLSQFVEKQNHDAIKQSETMHNAKAPAPSLTDAQFQAVNGVFNTIATENLKFTKALAPCQTGTTSTAAAPCGLTGTAVVPVESAFLSAVQKAIAALPSLAPGVVMTNIQNDLNAVVAKIQSAIGQ